MWIFILLITYFVGNLIIDVHTPVIRFAIFPLLYLFFKFKDRIDIDLFKLSRSDRWKRALIVLAVLLTVARCFHVYHKIQKPINFIEDIAVLNRDAVKTMFMEGKNPYSEVINSYVVVKNGVHKNYHGYKYPPLQIFYYAPFVYAFDLKGIYVGNFLMYLLAGFALFFFMRKYSVTHGLLALLLYLGTEYYFYLAFNNGTNDFVSSIFMLISIMLLQRDRNKSSAIIFGLSLLAKQLPGGLIAIFLLLQKRYQMLLGASTIFLLGVLPFCIWDFTGIFENTIEFALTRPVRETSFLFLLPSFFHKAVPLLGICAVSILAYLGNKHRYLNLKNGWNLIVLGVLIFLITAKMSPTHYFVWITSPFILMLLVPRQEYLKK